MKHKNGFTLIELLAVIIILGVILLIVIPSSLNTIDNASRNTFTASAKSLIDIAKEYVATENPNLPAANSYITIPITSLNFDNSSEYADTGGVVIANIGTSVNDDYELYVYLSNSDYVINGANKGNIKSNIQSAGTHSAVEAPGIASILISVSNGITGDVEGITTPTGDYETYTSANYE